MKNFIITLVFAFATHAFYAQGAFDKFDGQDDVTSVIVNKKMFDIMSKVKVDPSDKETQQYMVAEIGDDVEAEADMDGDGLVECGVEKRHHLLEIGPLATGTQADAGQIALRRHAVIGIDAEVHPRAVELVLDRLGDR